MNPFEKSKAINYAHGAGSAKEAYVERLKADYNRNFSKSLEHEAGAKRNGTPQEFIAHKTKGSQRYSLSSKAGETFFAGDIIECYNSHWIVVEVEANKDIYTSGYMERCNHLFKFVAGGKIIERWGVLDSGVYSTTLTDTLLMPELNKQFKIYLPYDDDTKLFSIGRRFAVGTTYDEAGKQVLVAYKITGYDPATMNYGEDALLVLNCKSDAYDPVADNLELEICDYNLVQPDSNDALCTVDYVGKPFLRVGGGKKTFVCKFADANGNEVSPDDVEWTITTVDNTGLTTHTTTNASITISLSDQATIGTLYTIKAESESLDCSGTLIVKGAGMI